MWFGLSSISIISALSWRCFSASFSPLWNNIILLVLLLVTLVFDFLLDLALFMAALFIVDVIFEQEGIFVIILFIEFILLILLDEFARRFDEVLIVFMAVVVAFIGLDILAIFLLPVWEKWIGLVMTKLSLTGWKVLLRFIEVLLVILFIAFTFVIFILFTLEPIATLLKLFCLELMLLLFTELILLIVFIVFILFIEVVATFFCSLRSKIEGSNLWVIFGVRLFLFTLVSSGFIKDEFAPNLVLGALTFSNMNLTTSSFWTTSTTFLAMSSLNLAYMSLLIYRERILFKSFDIFFISWVKGKKNVFKALYLFEFSVKKLIS